MPPAGPYAHSTYAPSSSERWLECPSSVGFSSSSGAEADLGTELHEYAANRICGHCDPEPDNPAEPFVSAVAAVATSGTLYTETPLGDSEFGGTPDALVVTDEALHVLDLKTGRVFVPANTPQLGCYLLLARRTHGPRALYRATIVQPLHGCESRTHEWTHADLDRLEARVAEAMEAGEGAFRAGTHCRYCPALPICHPAREYWLKGVHADEDIVEGARVYEVLVESAKKRLIQRIEGGEEVPGFRVIAKKTPRQWTEAAAEWASEHPRAAELVQPKPVTPAAAEKLLGEALPPGLTTQKTYPQLVGSDVAAGFDEIVETT